MFHFGLIYFILLQRKQKDPINRYASLNTYFIHIL